MKFYSGDMLMILTNMIGLGIYCGIRKCQNIKRIFRPISLPLLHYSTFSYSLVSYFSAQSMCSKMTSSFYRERDGSIEIILDNFTSTAFTHIILIIFDDVAFKKTDFLDKYTKTNCSNMISIVWH